jgi:hypothetical protein
VPPRWWALLRETSALFLDEWGATAEGLGWTTADLFAVNGKVPYTRIDQYGLCPLLAGRCQKVIALTAEVAVIQSGSNRTTFRRQEGESPGVVFVWTLGT